jgi:hypothetical protein
MALAITAGIMALSRKRAEEKAKKEQARQGILSIGSSDVAKKAFDAQTNKMIEAGPSPPGRAGTNIKFEGPEDIQIDDSGVTTPSSAKPASMEKSLERGSSLDGVEPEKSEKGYLSPHTAVPTTPGRTDSQSSRARSSTDPPPYSPMREQRAPPTPSASVASGALSPSTLAPSATRTSFTSSRSTSSKGTHAIRVKTNGPDLSSGFPYHPALFDLQVHPDKWNSFTSEIIERTKLTSGDKAKLWGTATGLALSGALVTSVFVHR